MQIHLFFQYYDAKSAARQKEIDECLRKNVFNPAIDTVHVLIEQPYLRERVPRGANVLVSEHPDRMTYGMWLRLTDERLRAGDLSILVNADIYLDLSVNKLRNGFSDSGAFLALSRYDRRGEVAVLRDEPHWTQDTWVVMRGRDRFPSALLQEANFELGHPGCDNKIAYLMHSYGFRVSNPCLELKTVHLQADESRAYDAKKNKLIGMHAFVHPVQRIGMVSRLEFQLLSRAAEDIEHIWINNWINDRKQYPLVGKSPNDTHRPKAPNLVPSDVLAGENTSLTEPFAVKRRAEPSLLPERLQSILSNPDQAPSPDSDKNFEWIDRNVCRARVKQGEIIARYGERFQVVRHKGSLYFIDEAWPSVGVSLEHKLPPHLGTGIELFLWGFGQPLLTFGPSYIANKKRFARDYLFWQYPARTEADAFDVHASLVGPQVVGNELQLYLGLPWATWIDMKRVPSNLSLYSDRVQSIRAVLKEYGITVRLHTVCQHIFWRDFFSMFKRCGVGVLWLSHKPQGESRIDEIELRPWHLYPVNARDGSRRENLVIRDPGDRPWLASFIGAHMKHYITDVRLKIRELAEHHRFFIELNDEWHFNEIVYREQIREGFYDGKKLRNPHLTGHLRYNKIMADSVFALCPAGAGPNSLRLWEALSVGAVPVVLADGLCLPDIAEVSAGRFREWDDLVIRVPEAEVESLPLTLSQISIDRIRQLAGNGVELMQALNRYTCLGKHADRTISPLPRGSARDKKKPTIVIPMHGPGDRWFWRQKKRAFYKMVTAWYERDYVDISFGDSGYYWWGRDGEILLMERDNVVNLRDGKKDPPRWQGEVPYKHAIFFCQYHIENSRNHKAPAYFAFDPPLLERWRERKGRVPHHKRSIGSVFAGSMENETQEFFRNRFRHWDSAIEVFEFTDRLNTKQSPKRTPEEYLDLISQARFGVCFRGNGPKCFREMEYLAVGTPLIITEGVEVNYPEPLLEGVHFFRADEPEDICRIVAQTSAEQWETMSRACWEWFDRNATIDSLFKGLCERILSLDLSARRHQTVRINAPKPTAAASLAARSLAIVDPSAKWLARDDSGKATLEVDPNDLFVNELPAIGSENEYLWRIEPKGQEAYAQSVLATDLSVHKRLLELLGLRLPNFRVTILKKGRPVSLWNYRDSDGLVLRSEDEEAILRTDFDCTRRCEVKYVDRELRISGPARITRPVFKVDLQWERAGERYQESLSEHFAEYHASYDEIIPPEKLYRLCKLWQRENSENFSVTGTVEDCDRVTPINYTGLGWDVGKVRHSA